LELQTGVDINILQTGVDINIVKFTLVISPLTLVLVVTTILSILGSDATLGSTHLGKAGLVRGSAPDENVHTLRTLATAQWLNNTIPFATLHDRDRRQPLTSQSSVRVYYTGHPPQFAHALTARHSWQDEE
jgi:hypothetical protein